MNVLTLEVTDFVDPTNWRWVLKDAGGRFLADHKATFARSAPEFQGFIDLPAFLRHHGVGGDASDETERRLLLDFGRWLNDAAFGSLAVTMKAYAPVTVRVVVPATAEGLLQRPFEAATVDDEPLSSANVTLVFEVADDLVKPVKHGIGDALRILAVFSLPPLESPLNLRTERQSLRRLAREMVGGGRRAAIELRTLQYGTTRETLRDVLDDGDGWDIVHFSGHGMPGQLILESEGGQPDVIDSDGIVQILQQHSSRIKLVTISACHSGAGDIRTILAGIGIEAAEFGYAGVAQARPGLPVARALAKALDCAVVAMRFPVEDRFAIELGDALYRQLITKRVTLPQALQRAVRTAFKTGMGHLSSVTPTLLGRQAVGLTLAPPKAAGRLSPTQGPGTFGFPPEAEHFVGRVAAMTRASGALAVQNPARAVLFHGMSGAGKSACAIELAHHFRQTDRFQAWVWFKAPDKGRDIATVLRDFALAMEIQIPGFSMMHGIESDDSLTRWLPQLEEVLTDRAVFIALDNVDSLLTDSGGWRDPLFGRVVTALIGHPGLSRTVMTSRVTPSQLPSTVLVEPVHSLSLAEATLLMSRPPRLYRLLTGGAHERDVARRLLGVVQGHPKLIQLAEGMAGDIGALERQIERAEAVWLEGGSPTTAFFATGTSQNSDDGFLRTLDDWTDGAASGLADTSLLMFRLLCIAEEGDREDWIIRSAWLTMWMKLSGPIAGAPSADEAIAPLIAAALAESTPDGDVVRWSIHPAVAARGASGSGGELFQTVTEALADFWCAVYQTAREAEGSGGGSLIRRSALAAAPYLLRLGRWSVAGTLLEQALARDGSPGTVAAVLPWLRTIAEATQGTGEELFDRGKYAKALRLSGRSAEAEAEMRRTLLIAVERKSFRLASGLCGELVNLLGDTGRLDEALALVKEKAGYTKRGGLGPWTQMLDAAKRLGILLAQGKYQQVLNGVAALQARFPLAAPHDPGNEAADPWNVQEVVFDLGRSAAERLKRWRRALAFNDLARESMRARGADVLDRTRVDFGDHTSLINLKRYGEARLLLEGCRDVYEHHRELRGIAVVLSALGSLEHCVHGNAPAQGFEIRALRYHYMVGDPQTCAVSHFNLANYLMEVNPAASIGHHIAATMLGWFSNSDMLKTGLNALTVQLLGLGEAARPNLPGSFAALCSEVEKVEGVRFRQLLDRLNGDRADLDVALGTIIQKGFEFVAVHHSRTNTEPHS